VQRDFFISVLSVNINCKIASTGLFLRGIFKTMFHLLQANITKAVTDVNNAASYLPIGLQLLFAGGMIGTLLIVTHLLGPKRKTADKLQNFASGIESHGEARQPMAIKYFLVAILFVLFDVEVIFFYPYAVNFKGLGWSGFWAVLMFVGFFLCGFIYIVKKGALKWED
jgi:NADH-quinone oxidoreductase subunit A